MVPALLALAAAIAADRAMVARRLVPRLFMPRPNPLGTGPAVAEAALRRAGATAVLFLVFWIGVFAPLGTLGRAAEIDVRQLRIPQLFLIHALLLLALAAWYACGFSGGGRRVQEPGRAAGFSAQFGLRTPGLANELVLGLGAGLVTWLVVLTFLVAVGVLIWSLGGVDSLAEEPPAIIPWIASLPVVVRLAVSASAGFFEELFFRGFLQPRVGIAFSTALFVLAHSSYEQPLMLVGVTALSLVFAFLVRWRQSIWAAVVAHAVFDAVQLLVVIPAALRFLESQV